MTGLYDESNFEFSHGEPLEVAWIDSTSSNGWTQREAEIGNPKRRLSMYCVTIGYVLCEDDDALTLTMSWSGNDYISEQMTIPKRVIVWRRHPSLGDVLKRAAGDRAAGDRPFLGSSAVDNRRS